MNKINYLKNMVVSVDFYFLLFFYILDFALMYLSYKRRSWFYAVIASALLISIDFFLHYIGVRYEYYECFPFNILNNSTTVDTIIKCQTSILNVKISEFVFYLNIGVFVFQIILGIIFALLPIGDETKKI
jgi:hypothetical protein